MTVPLRIGRRGLIWLAVSALAAVGFLVTVASGGAAAAAQPATKVYLVQTVGAPLASYTGGVSGIAATKPAEGGSLDATTAAAKAYRSHLASQHRDVLTRSRLGTNRLAKDYGVAFNGFAARLTPGEALRLKATPGVIKVWENEILTVDTTTTPHFLGLDGSTGVWQKQFGGVKHAGEGVIIGDLDSGIWPENPSFAALPEPRPDRRIIARKWHGACVAGVEEPVTCNNKLIGARYYSEFATVTDDEFLSPRDFDGHGSHTASTAAGNNNVPAAINGLSVGSVSGMAPAARLAVYKVLWENEDHTSASGATADIVAAIDDAVADGVDVINYSISGSRLFVVDPVEIAFLNAADAGVFVATSAGNNGDTIGTSSVAHNSPWEMTVAASSHDRGSAKTVTLGDGSTYNGVGVGPAVGSTPVILSTTAGLPGADPTMVRLCFSDEFTPDGQPVLDPAKIAGKIVVCDRGVSDRVDKSRAVGIAGGVGMILTNTSAAQSLNADFHSVPTIHVDSTSAAAIKVYVSGSASPTAAISAVSTAPVRAPAMAGFSSFGPALAGGGDLLKPDITAPGVDVIAAVAPPNNAGNTFFAYSGTSMSTPHIAGLAALIKGAHPNWPPMWIKSALMTTATPLDNNGLPIQRGGTDATPLDFGSGHVVPKAAFDPGLVYSSNSDDWLRYACGIGQLQLITDPSLCASVGSIDPSDLNYPTIAVGDLAGTQTIRRTVTNVSLLPAIYKPKVTAPAGVTVKISPSALLVLPGHKATFKVTLTRTTAPLGAWAFGSLTWSDGNGFGHKHAVRSVIAVRPVALAAPAEVAQTGTAGSATLSVRAGYTGTLTTSVNGLAAASVTDLPLTVAGPAFDPNNPATSTSTGVVAVTVPAGTTLARFATFDADYAAGTDLDLFVYRVEGAARTLVASSAGGTAEESVDVTEPGDYEAYVNVFALPTGSTSITVHHNNWAVPGAAAGNLTATPASQSVTTGAAAAVTLTWNGLTSGTRYLGVIAFGDGTSTIATTVVTVAG